MSPDASRSLNAVGLLAVCGILLGGYYFQFALGELPCPLCLLQRVGFVAVGFGLALNLIYGPRPSHYGIMLVGALYGGSVAVRQVLLHIVPGTGAYGSPVLGLHYYTWSAIVFFLVLAGTALMLLFDRQFEHATGDEVTRTTKFGGSGLARFAFVVLVLTTLSDAVLTLLECGPFICDDPPTSYKFLDELMERWGSAGS
jgi:disulfide bond formation protein DsbB